MLRPCRRYNIRDVWPDDRELYLPPISRPGWETIFGNLLGQALGLDLELVETEAPWVETGSFSLDVLATDTKNALGGAAP